MKRSFAIVSVLCVMFAGGNGAATSDPAVNSPAKTQNGKPAARGPMVNNTTIDTTQHSQALIYSLATGSPRSSDYLVDLCYVLGDLWRGTTAWDLVYNKATGVAGFVSESELYSYSQAFECYHSNPTLDYDINYTTISTTQHSQAFVHSLATGSPKPSDTLLDMCYVKGDWWGGTDIWHLVCNRATGVAGFVSESELRERFRYANCYYYV